MARVRSKTVAFGLFPSRADMENAVDALKMEGFQNSDISVLLPAGESQDFKPGESRSPEGGYLVTVHAADEDWMNLAQKILRSVGARTMDDDRSSRPPQNRPLFDRKFSVSHHKY